MLLLLLRLWVVGLLGLLGLRVGFAKGGRVGGRISIVGIEAGTAAPKAGSGTKRSSPSASHSAAKSAPSTSEACPSEG